MLLDDLWDSISQQNELILLTARTYTYKNEKTTPATNAHLYLHVFICI